MSTYGLRKCGHCKRWFRPDRQNAWHQRYCAAPECRSASVRASQRKWCRKNPSYFRGEIHVNRVRVWRREHPGYWRRKGEAAADVPRDALQELLTAHGFARQAVGAFRICLQEEISRPLQELFTVHDFTLLGLAAMISGEVLQDDIARMVTAWHEKGRRIGGRVPWMQPPPACAPRGMADKEVTHARTRTPRTPPTPTYPTPVQLGRSPSGP